MFGQDSSDEEALDMLPCFASEGRSFQIGTAAVALQLSQCNFEEQTSPQRVELPNPLQSQGSRRFLCLESSAGNLQLVQRSCSLRSVDDADAEVGEEVLPCTPVGGSSSFFIPSQGNSLSLRICQVLEENGEEETEEDTGLPRTSQANGADPGAIPIVITQEQLVDKICLDSSDVDGSLAIKVRSCLNDDTQIPTGAQLDFLPCFGESQVYMKQIKILYK